MGRLTTSHAWVGAFGAALLLQSPFGARAECPTGEVEDCWGNCAPAGWVGDTYCDDGTYLYNGNPIYFNCSQWSHDGGDCNSLPPVSGTPVPSMAALDVKMIHLMDHEGITAAAMGVMKNGRIVYQRFFGWKDEALSQSLQPDAMMRIASVSKPHTAACIRQLIAAGVISLNDKVFNLGQDGGGLLTMAPFSGLGDARLADITVDHLLRHRGGWDRDTAALGDLTYLEIKIKSDYNQDTPPTRQQTVSWILSQPLQFSPDRDRAYSNIGYLVLGLIVEQYSGQKYLDYLHGQVLSPLGVQSNAVIDGRTFAANHDAREPWYHIQNTDVPDVFATLADLANDPADHTVPYPYGGWCHETRISQGGLVATPRALLKYLDVYTVAGDDIGMPRDKPAEPVGWSYVHTGALKAGTQTLAQQWGDGYNFVVLFNKNGKDDAGDSFVTVMRDSFRNDVDAGTILVPDCPPGYIEDCNGNCVPELWLGNGTCDTQTWFGDVEVNFNCAALSFDHGDCTPPCPADIDGSGGVDISDLLIALDAWGPCADPVACSSDLDGDGYVDIGDLLEILAAMGPCPG